MEVPSNEHIRLTTPRFNRGCLMQAKLMHTVQNKPLANVFVDVAHFYLKILYKL